MKIATENPNCGAAQIRILGGIMFFCSLAIIVMCWINHFANQSQWNEHPLKTYISDGANLSKMDYTFLPPWTGFEVSVLMIGIVGAVLINVKVDSTKPNDDK